MALSSTVPVTAWRNSRLDARPGPPKLLFGRMHEDAAIELSTFPSGGRIFCIASAGCTAMQLSSNHDVVAVDLNPFQVEYAQRRLAGSPTEQGHADQMLSFARVLAPLVGWKRPIVDQFLELDDSKEQIRYWHRYLDTLRFRVAFDFLISRTFLRFIYSASFLDCLPSRPGLVMRSRMERCFSLHSNKTNPYARAHFLGDSAPAPNSGEAGHIQFHCADAAAFLESQPPGSFTGFSLSNILDGTNRSYRERLLNAVRNSATPDALVVLRSFREPNFSTTTNRAAEDRSMLWGTVDVRPASVLGASRPA